MLTAIVILAFLAGAMLAQNLNQLFPLPPSFSQDYTTNFAWDDYQSTDVLELYAQGTKGGKDTKESIALPCK